MNLHDYNSDVNEVLGKRRPGSNHLRFGAEVETGWHLEGAREDFFKALTAEGLDKLAIPKFDRSITSAACAEIVTLPMKMDELTPVLKSIGTILTKQTKDSSMQNCGVHIHATRTAMHTDQFWRAVCAIMIKENDYKYYWSPGKQRAGGGSEAQRFNAAVKIINEFWTKIALRNPTRYCQRYGYHNLANASGRGAHQCAVTLGKHTPTVEFRLFKTARSPVVLASYAEAVAALVAFSDAPPAGLLDTSNLEAIEREQKHREAKLEYLEILRSHAGGLYVAQIEDFYGYNRGTLSRDNVDIERYWTSYGGRLARYIINGYSWEDLGYTRDDEYKNEVQHFVSKQLYKELYALRERLVPTESKSLGAVSWKDNLFPVFPFMEYIEANGNTYPNLAERLQLPKFKSMVGRGAVNIADNPEPYDTKAKHKAVRFGCIVKNQTDNADTYVGGRTPEYRVLRRIKTGQGLVAEDFTYEAREIQAKGMSPADELVFPDEREIDGSNILHMCEGAELQEGHDE